MAGFFQIFGTDGFYPEKIHQKDAHHTVVPFLLLQKTAFPRESHGRFFFFKTYYIPIYVIRSLYGREFPFWAFIRWVLPSKSCRSPEEADKWESMLKMCGISRLVFSENGGKKPSQNYPRNIQESEKKHRDHETQVVPSKI